MLHCTNITVRKGGAIILDDVSMAAAPGEITVIIGPNGAGKTTLAHTLLGDERPATGEVYFCRHRIRDWSPRVRARQIAFLSQSQTLQFPFTVREVVLMGRLNHYRFLERPEDLHAAETALRRVGLPDFAEREFPTLSGGEKQRVSLARALCQLALGEPQPGSEQLPKYLILDEPNNNLDIRHQLGVLEIARELRDQGIGIIAILHDLAQARSLADHLVVLNQGRLAAAGPGEVLDPGVIETVFGVCLRGNDPLRFPFQMA